MDLYPTSGFLSSYRSNRKVSLTAGVVAIIVGISVIFLMFDGCSRIRLRSVREAAAASASIVDDIFPRAARCPPQPAGAFAGADDARARFFRRRRCSAA